MFSNVEVYINNQQIYNSKGLYAHKCYNSSNFKGAISEYKVVLHCEWYDYEEFFAEIRETPLPELFSLENDNAQQTWWLHVVCCEMGVDFFSTSEMLYLNMKIRLQLIRARPNFYMIGDNHNVSLGIVDSSLYARCIALKDDYHKARMDLPAYTAVEFNYLESPAKTFIIPVRRNQFIQETIFNNAPVRRIAFAMNTNSECTGF